MTMSARLTAPGEPTPKPHVNQAEAIDYQVTPSFVALLEKLGCSLVITNYQSSTVMTFSSLGDGRPVQMFAAFPAAMGLALEGDRLAVAGLSEVIVLSNIRKLAPGLPKFPGLFVGLSLMRGSRPFEGLPVEHGGKEVICGVVAIELATGQVVGTLRYTGGCTEIHDLQVMAGVRRLGISGYDSDAQAMAVDMPDVGLWLEPSQQSSQEPSRQSVSPANAPGKVLAHP